MGNNEIFKSRLPVDELSQSVASVKSEVARIIVGQEKMIEQMLVAILANGHILIEGVPGVAKTLAAKIMARTISSKFSRIQFTPDLMPSDILGTNVFNMSSSAFEFRPGPIFSNIILIDEINRAPAKTQAALFEVMEEQQITLDGKTYPMDSPFLVFATQNPIEYEGTYRLPEAQLDRFLLKIKVDYPSLDEEVAILSGNHERRGRREVEGVRPVLSAAQIITYQDLVQQVQLEDNLKRYISLIIQKTRNYPSIYLGASPRASIYLMTASKALAIIRGRDFITPDDIREMINPVLGHRIILTAEKEMEGQTTADALRQVVQSIDVPR
jgi:MoxR-like ATPase